MDDWRVTVDLADERASAELVEWLRETRLDADAREHLGERIAVSRAGPQVFLYADTEERARKAERLVAARLADSGPGRVELARWHPVEQRWEDASVPLPRTEEEWRVEHERLQAREAAESEASGAAEWEVRIELPNHEATVEFAERLTAESIPVVRRHTFVLVGAVNEDEARALAERLAAEAPAGSRIEVEPGGQMVWEVAPQNPFVVFGGLGV